MSFCHPFLLADHRPFSSTLSHDFYQVMIGRKDMNLFGWKQLIEWSLEHASMTQDEYEVIHTDWTSRWNQFLDDVVAEFEQEQRCEPTNKN